MKKIGTLSAQVKLTDEEIDALPRVIKFIKNQLVTTKSDNELVVNAIAALNKMVNLDALEFDPLLDPDSEDTNFGLAMALAIAATADSKKKAAEEGDYKERVKTLTDELMKRDEKIKRLEDDLADALAKKNPSTFRPFYEPTWVQSRRDNPLHNPYEVTSSTGNEYSILDSVLDTLDELSKRSKK